MTTFRESNWHPLTWLSHMLDCQMFGLKPAGHHLVNLALHAINAALLYLILLRMTRELAQCRGRRLFRRASAAC